MIRRLLAVAGLVVALAGCAAGPAAVAPSVPPLLVPASAVPVAAATPVHFAYPGIGVSGNLEPSGLNADGTAQVPPVTEPMQATYLAWAPALAAARPVVLYGHVDGRDSAGRSVPGVFSRLTQAEVGDLITVDLSDGASRTYRVTDKRQVDKDAFPTAFAYGAVDVPTVRLVTCGGAFQSDVRSYADNIVVSAVAT